MELDDALRAVSLREVRRDVDLARRVMGRITDSHPPEYQAVRRLVETHVAGLLGVAGAASRTVARIPAEKRPLLR